MKSADPTKVYNSCLVYDSEGEAVARYDKIHLFVYSGAEEHHDEADTYLAGDKAVSFPFPLQDGSSLRIGLGICYDLRFPEQFRDYGADLIVLPSAFTVKTGEAHWEVLLRARAIENLCYVAAPAQAGTNPQGRSFYGHSMFIDGWGTVKQSLGPTETGVVEGNLDPEFLRHIRTILPALNNRAEFKVDNLK